MQGLCYCLWENGEVSRGLIHTLWINEEVPVEWGVTSPPLIKWWVRKTRYLTLYSWGSRYGSWEMDLGLPLVKDMTKGFCSSLQSSSFPTLFYMLADIKDYWAKLVDDRWRWHETIVTQETEERKWRIQAVRSGPKLYPSGTDHSSLLCSLLSDHLHPWLCLLTHQSGHSPC